MRFELGPVKLMNVSDLSRTTKPESVMLAAMRARSEAQPSSAYAANAAQSGAISTKCS